MIKAIFLDIDGTLVSFDTHAIPLSAIEALTQAKAKGVKIFIATGRAKVLITNLGALQERGLIDGYVTMNGAYCFVGDEVIYKRPIPPDDIHLLAAYCDKRQVPYIVVDEHSLCVCHPDEMVRNIFLEYLKVERLPEKSPEDALRGKEIYELTPFISQQQETEIAPLIPNSEVCRWHPAFADVTAKGCTKQRGIDEMMRHFGLTREEVMAIGDGGNDIPMLRHAGTGVAMGNASDEVKAAADYVTTTVDDDGIAHALRHFGIV